MTLFVLVNDGWLLASGLQVTAYTTREAAEIAVGVLAEMHPMGRYRIVAVDVEGVRA